MAFGSQKRGPLTRMGLIARLKTKKEKNNTSLLYCPANCTVNLPSLVGVAPINFVWF